MMKKITAIDVLGVLNTVVKGFYITEEQLGDDLAGKGMDSIEFIRLIVALEETFECEIPDEKLIFSEMNTAQKIVDVLQELSNNIDCEEKQVCTP